MSDASTDKAAFARLVSTLNDYLDTLVFAGGWAHRLHALHPLARTPDFQPLLTRDADVAAPLRMGKRAQGLAELLKAAGFTEVLKGDDKPPISEYHLGNEHTGFYVEFLTPQVGGGRKRDGTRDDTVDVAGVTAQKLRHVDLLMQEPWIVRLNDANGFPLGAGGVESRVVNPACFIAQKLLVLKKRKPEKQPKDVLYLHDTLLLFSAGLPELRATWQKVEPALHPNVLKELRVMRTELTSQLTDRVRAAVQIAASTGRPSPPSPDVMLRVLRAGFDAIFGPLDARG